MMTSASGPEAGSHTIASSGIVVIIVNYCTAGLVVDCLRSLCAHRAEFSDMTVVVADNASPDGSGRKIDEAIAANGWGDWARLRPMPRNGGFGYANNAVINESLHTANAPRYFWLLNSDTLVRPGALGALLAFMEEHPKVGIAGSRLEDPDGTAQHSAFRFPTIAAEFEASIRLGLVTKLLDRWRVAPPIASQNTQYDWLAGASLLIRTETLRQAGLFDETYFLYYEEVDLCMRAKRHGWSCWYVPASRVVHLVGMSTGVTERTSRPRRRAQYWFQSRRYYFVKHYGRVYASIADVALAAGSFLGLLRAGIQGRPSLHPERFLYDLARHSATLKLPHGPAPR